MQTIQTVGVAIIAAVVLFAGYSMYQDKQATEDNKPPAIMCIVGDSTDCGSGDGTLP